MGDAWWQGFFDEDYLQVWGTFLPDERTEEEADGLWKTLALAPGSRVLDAPCGWGRLSAALARRGARVVGVDQSAHLLAVAERARGALPTERLRYVEHDLRAPLAETGFDAAINVFSSIGYGSEDDDLAILETLAAAVRPGGLVLVETMHRDLTTVRFAKGPPPGHRAPDGTLVIETPRFDAVTGRVETTWFWSSPRGSGSKSASLRMYAATELVRLVERAGLRFRAAQKGCFPEPFRPFEDRLGLLAEKPA
jgi:SAM-dependent methyltransferase